MHGFETHMKTILLEQYGMMVVGIHVVEKARCFVCLVQAATVRLITVGKEKLHKQHLYRCYIPYYAAISPKFIPRQYFILYSIANAITDCKKL